MDPGSIAIGALVGTIWWIIFIFFVFIPKIKRLEERIEGEKDRIETKIDEQLARIPDIDEVIAKAKTDIDAKALLKPVVAELKKPMNEWEPDMKDAIANVLGGGINMMMYHIENDENFNKWFYDKYRGLAMNMKKEMKSEIVEMVPEIGKAVGIDPAALKGGMEALDMIPEEYRGWAALFMQYMKGGIGGGGGGDYYGGGY